MFQVKFDEVLRVLARHEVEHIVVGGIAAILQGSPLTTEDVDVVFACNPRNIARLEGALAELEAHYLDPAGRHIVPNAERLASMRVHLLRTNCGRLDVLRTVGDDRSFDDLIDQTSLFRLDDVQIRVLDLAAIIETKEYANRPKDQYQLPFLRQLLEEILQNQS